MQGDELEDEYFNLDSITAPSLVEIPKDESKEWMVVSMAMEESS